MKNISLILVLILGLTACSSTSKKISSPDVVKEFVFPNGVYQHDVELAVLSPENPEIKDEKPQYYHFKGVVQLKKDLIQIVGLSPFGTTVFKITDDRVSGKITDEIYIDRIKPYEAKILDYYSRLKLLLTAKRGNSGDLTVIKPDEFTTITFEQYDQNHIPSFMRIDSKNFKVEIKVVGYDL